MVFAKFKGVSIGLEGYFPYAIDVVICFGLLIFSHAHIGLDILVLYNYNDVEYK